eukprot:COSAG02_NODE_20_length_53673_cov_86.864841_12_plen_107_part_00
MWAAILAKYTFGSSLTVTCRWAASVPGLCQATVPKRTSFLPVLRARRAMSTDEVAAAQAAVATGADTCAVHSRADPTLPALQDLCDPQRGEFADGLALTAHASRGL